MPDASDIAAPARVPANSSSPRGLLFIDIGFTQVIIKAPEIHHKTSL